MNRIVALYVSGACCFLLAALCFYWFFATTETIEQSAAAVVGLVTLSLSGVLIAAGFYLGGLRVRRTEAY